jgi:membrane-bound lytic murein transglycosylase D
MKKHLWKAFSLYPILTFATAGISVKAGSPEHGHVNNAAKKNLISREFNDTLAAFAGTKKIATSPEIKLQRTVEAFVKEYLERNDEMLELIKLKGNSCFNTIEKVLEKYGVPVELKYLAVIESKLKTSATSRVGAAGIWQIMPKTGRILGLKITGKTDERRYIYKSSVAAAKYLNDLYKEYDDWLLVIAAYNAGPGTLNKAIKRSGSRDFWKLQYFLPKETRLHVKKFIATHYYYEEKGSLVTLTKSEREKHLRAVREFETLQNDTEETPPEEQKFFNWVMVTNDQNNRLKVMARI